MKKLFFIFLGMLTFYLAGMYRYRSLMVLACLEAVFFLILFLLSRYFKRNLSVKVLRHSDSVEKGEPLTCGLRVDNRGKLPVSLFRIRILYGYGRGHRPAVRHIYGGSERGEKTLRFEILGSYCGMMYLNMSRLRTYDYLSLFSSSRKMEEEIRIAVFPRERALGVELPSLCYEEDSLMQEHFAGHGQDAHHEIRQLREYRPEDSRRHIHWKQSARTGQLLVKEYEKEFDYHVRLNLLLEGFPEADDARLDDFYELLSALLLGLLEKAAVEVCWYDRHQRRLVEMEAACPAQCREVLLALYGMEARERTGDADGEMSEADPGQDGFRLDLDLGWYWNDSLIFRFSREEMDDQIAHRVFVV